MAQAKADLCGKCRVVVEKICSSESSSFDGEPYSASEVHKSPCGLCGLICRALSEAGFDLQKGNSRALSSSDEPKITLIAIQPAGKPSDPCYFLFPGFKGAPPPHVNVNYKESDDLYADEYQRQIRFFSKPGRCESLGKGRALQLRQDAGSEAAKSPRFGSVPQFDDSGSSDAICLVKSWYQKCLQDHPECRKTYSGAQIDEDKGTALPTRVLDLNSGNGTIRLVTTKGSAGQFAALSYCWGPPEKCPPKTTKGTMDAHCAGVPEDKFPKTHRDAIHITRNMGLRYLWIDSFCIIQDDPKDWEREAASMASVYQHASIVIAASDSADPTQGLFRDLRRGEPAALPYIHHGGQEDGFIYAELRPRENEADPQQSILNTRGWCAQESILARRAIYYTQKDFVWACRKFPRHGLCHDGRSLSGFLWSKTNWEYVVRDYSRRNLTYSKDKLIALAGVASEIEQTTKDTYLYGCWKRNLPGHLLWSRAQPDWLQKPSELEHVPSWSWASTMGAVDFFANGAATTDAPVESCASVRADSPEEELEIESHLFNFSIKPLAEPISGDARGMPSIYGLHCNDGEEPRGIANFDRECAKEDLKSVLCVPLVWEHPEETPGFESSGRHHCIIVKPSSEPGDRFVRVGHAVVDHGEEVGQLINRTPLRRIVLC